MIRRSSTSLALTSLTLVLGASSACAIPSDGVTSTSVAVVATTGSTDPMDHLNVLAGDPMEGRGTGTPGFQRAADYVVGECVKAGLSGAYPTAAAPYLQPFTVGGLGAPLAPLADEDGPHDFGSELFADAIYLSGDASTETRREMGERVCDVLTQGGAECPAGVLDGSIDPREIVSASQAAPTSASNVVGFFPGAGPHRSEIILFSAHLDHLGKTGGRIYPGADDNASGSAALLGLMHAVAAARATSPLDRTVAFLWTAGEEKGLLGGAYFADNSPTTIPLAQIKQVVNMDMVGYWDDTRFSVGTDGTPASATAVTQLRAANQTLPVPFAKVNQDIQQYKSRQDGYAFSRRHVPSIFVFEGLSNPDGGGSLMAHYHRTTDTLANFLADNRGTKIRKMALLLTATALSLANSP